MSTFVDYTGKYLRQSMNNSTGNTIGYTINTTTGNKINNSIGYTIGNTIGNNTVGNTIGNTVGNNTVGNTIGNTVGNTVGNSINNTSSNPISNTEIINYEIKNICSTINYLNKACLNCKNSYSIIMMPKNNLIGLNKYNNNRCKCNNCQQEYIINIGININYKEFNLQMCANINNPIYIEHRNSMLKGNTIKDIYLLTININNKINIFIINPIGIFNFYYGNTVEYFKNSEYNYITNYMYCKDDHKDIKDIVSFDYTNENEEMIKKFI
jgi:hypothetical protein